MVRATALVLAVTAAILAAPAAAQDAPDAAWGAAVVPAAPAAVVAPPLASAPPPRANGPFTLELLLGTGANGGGGGLRASLGLELGEGWRLEFGAGGLAENGSAPGAGGELQLARAFGEVGVARRLGRIEPWVAVGVARFSGDYTATTSGPVCLPGTILCGEVDGLVTAEGTGEAVGPQVAAGVRFALSDTWLAGVTLRKAFVEPSAMGELARLVDPAAPWFGVAFLWRPGGGR